MIRANFHLWTFEKDSFLLYCLLFKEWRCFYNGLLTLEACHPYYNFQQHSCEKELGIVNKCLPNWLQVYAWGPIRLKTKPPLRSNVSDSNSPSFLHFQGFDYRSRIYQAATPLATCRTSKSRPPTWHRYNIFPFRNNYWPAGPSTRKKYYVSIYNSIKVTAKSWIAP